MPKRKVFPRTNLDVPRVEHTRTSDGRVNIPLELIPPSSTVVAFPREGNASGMRNFDFSQWYGAGIDAITYACQRQIERFLATHDGDRAPTTVGSYCFGLKKFLDYCILTATALARAMTLSDVNRALIDGFLSHLRDGGKELGAQKKDYDHTKAVLVAVGKRQLISVVAQGEDATFPGNPFPASLRKAKGAKALSLAERNAFAAAVKTAVMPLLHEGAEPTSELLACALLIIALHTGRNTTPLLELMLDCLRPHPKENVKILVCYKRRGNRTDKVPVRDLKEIEGTATVWTGVVRLIERVKQLTASLRIEAPEDLKDRLWLFRSTAYVNSGSVSTLTGQALARVTANLVKRFQLKDANGKPLRINVSRLRTTFSNRIFEILEGDLASTALATGNTPHVVGRHYMHPGENAEKNWRVMGQVLANELVEGLISATEKTPSGRCSNPKGGQFAPKNGATCMNFLSCLRCRNFVVTGDDLHRLLSFYWIVVQERDRINKRKWQRTYGHIVRLIDRDVIDAGIRKKAFSELQVIAARDLAKSNPHPYWASGDILEILQ